MEALLLVLFLFNVFLAVKYRRFAKMMDGAGAAAPAGPGAADPGDPRIVEILERIERLERRVDKAPQPVTAEEIERRVARKMERTSAEQFNNVDKLTTPRPLPPTPPPSQPVVKPTVPAVLGPDEVTTIIDALRLGVEAGRPLVAAGSYEEVGRLLVSELIPERADGGLLERADLWLRSVSAERVRLIVPPIGGRPNGAETEKVAERPIERGIYGLVTAVVRPGLRVGERVAIRASIEQGV